MDKIDFTLNKVNLYEQIANALEKAIIRSSSKIEKLPSEQELSKRFSVSRTVIREAMKVLKERGLIVSRNGEGSYLSKPNHDTISNAINRMIQIDNISDDDLYNMRIILESAGAKLAAQFAKPEDIEHLEFTIQQMSETPLPTDKRLLFDSDFHITIAKASNNQLLRMFVEVMTILLRDYMIKGLPHPSYIQRTLREHKKIVSAIKSGDVEKAEAAIRDHLIASMENIKEYEACSKTSVFGTSSYTKGHAGFDDE
jgi:GntR family transcriptional repressor for pyruvate dehydrogenase complex